MKNEQLTCLLGESDFKYNQLISDINSLRKKKAIGVESPVNGKNNEVLDFQRKVSSNLENENRILQEDIEFLRIKVTEMEGKNAREIHQSKVVKDLMRQVGVNSEKEFYAKVLYLLELYNQSKEQIQLIQRIACAITQKTGRSQINSREIWNYLSRYLNA